MGRNNGNTTKHYFIRRSFIIGYVIALALICFFAWYTYYNMERVESETLHEEHILNSIKSLETVFDDIQEMESAQRGYILSKNKAFLQTFNKAHDQITTDTSLLTSLHTERNIREPIPGLLALIRQKIDLMRQTIQIRDVYGHEAAIKRVQSDVGRQTMEKIRHEVVGMEDVLKEELSDYGEKRARAARDTTQLFIILSAFFLIFLVTFFFLERGEIQKRFKKEVAKEVDKGIVDFKDILERINDGFIALDKDWKYVYLNKKSASIGSGTS